MLFYLTTSSWAGVCLKEYMRKIIFSPISSIPKESLALGKFTCLSRQRNCPSDATDVFFSLTSLLL